MVVAVSLILAGCAPHLVSGCVFACQSDSETAGVCDAANNETPIDGRCSR